MILKLSYANVKKSFKDYMVYFLTLMFSVCLFYTFNSFNSQQAIMDLNNAQSSLMMTIGLLMHVLSFFVAFILGFLVLYANNFLIKRRKKEFGLYLLMGMPKSMVSRILVCETFYVGLISLVCGLGLGIVMSQCLALITANLLNTTISYEFIFSFESMIITILSFGIIFLVVMFFNTRIFKKGKIIDLLHAKSKNEKGTINRLSVSVILFVISIILLGIAYYLALDMMTFYIFFLPIIILGILGTILFFMSLSGFFIKVIQTRKNFYYKGLNSFILKQVNAKITTNFMSMSAVCLLLLLSIGAFATGFSLSDGFNRLVEDNTPYELSIIQRSEEVVLSEQELSYVASMDEITVYQAELGISSFYNSVIEKDTTGYTKADFISLTDFNKLLTYQGLDTIELAPNHTKMVEGLHNGIIANEETDVVLNNQKLVNDEVFDTIPLSTNYQPDYRYYLVINDDELANLEGNITRKYFNINTKNELSFNALITGFNQNTSFISRYEVSEQSSSMSLLFTYIGIYLGFVFLMASAVILALQQLSQASENKDQYECLLKLGADKKMVSRALLKQIALYFTAPIFLAVIHSIVGIQAVLSGFTHLFGITSLLQSGFMTFCVFLVLYGFYYLITYFGCVRIVIQKDN